MVRSITQRGAERRQNLTQGEASPDLIGMSETMGSCCHMTRARLIGRQMSWRRTYSFSRFALLIFLAVVVACAGCTRRSDGGIGSRTGGLQPSVTLAQVSSSADVVTVNTFSVQQAAGSDLPVVVRLVIASGYHVNANPATYPYLIATEVKPGNSEGVTAGTPTYPTATKQKFEFAEEPLAVYEGNVDIALPLKISPGTTGQRSLPISVRVQACDTEKCFPPATINATIQVDVK